MPSITDSFGQTYLEAWLCGRPVVGARIATMECVIDHGIDGLLVTDSRTPACPPCGVVCVRDEGATPVLRRCREPKETA
jgi:glycosyltransferase involved in cell wall biosynthesis